MPKAITKSTYKHIPEFPLVVGGSGSIARHLLFLFADAGVQKCRILDLCPPSDPPKNLEIDFFPCNLMNELHKLSDAVHGCDSVFSFVSPDFTNCSDDVLYGVNVTAIKEILEESKKGTPKCFLFASSIAVTNHFTDISNGRESDPLPPLDTYWSAYDKSKRLGEEAVLSASTSDFPTVSLRLGGVIASYRDYILRDAFQNNMLVHLPGQKNIDFIFAKDVVHAFMLAYERILIPDNKVSGEIFYISKGESSPGGETWSKRYEKSFPGMRQIVMPHFFRWLLILCSYIYVFFASLFGYTVPSTPLYKLLRIALYEHTFDNSKAKDILGYESSWTIEEGLSWIFQDFQKRGGKSLLNK